ncbi:hypothetical protein F2Q69_00050566 [Brassica cretica]|uniref:Uncharacterized protein n=1 Tax=Brassica cretica TaxID=69181 RepID=A0A8S9PRR2_BRACR|nr:hypothetical protein F2Q69_00050566 [Brassica cretica]
MMRVDERRTASFSEGNVAPASNEPDTGTAKVADSRATARSQKAATSAQARQHDAAFIALRDEKVFGTQITIERRRILSPELVVQECKEIYENTLVDGNPPKTGFVFPRVKCLAASKGSLWRKRI